MLVSLNKKNNNNSFFVFSSVFSFVFFFYLFSRNFAVVTCLSLLSYFLYLFRNISTKLSAVDVVPILTRL